MKRLLAYLFIVLGLGLTFNVKAKSNEISFCVKNNFSKYDTQVWSGPEPVFLSKEGCYNHKKISEQEFIEIAIIFKRETSVSVGGAKKWMIAKSIKKEFLNNKLNTDLLDKILLEKNVVYKNTLEKINKDLERELKIKLIAKAEPSQTLKVASKKIIPKDLSPNQQYEFAVSFLKVGDYNLAEKAFREFVNTNPNHELAGSAQYWYAETFRIKQLWTDAVPAYLEGFQKYPTDNKAPINLLKLGVSLVQIGEKTLGCKIIVGMSKQYPSARQSVIAKSEYETKKFECNKGDTNFLAEIPKLLVQYNLTDKNKINNNPNSTKTVSLKLTKNEIDNLYSTVGSCWSIPLGLPYDKDLSVKIKVKLTPDGKIINTEILDYAKKYEPYYRVLAESALRAIKLCEPFKGPKNKYDLWKEIVFNFDARDVLYGTESEETKIAKNNLLNKSTETQIAKEEPTITPKKKIKVAKVEEPKQEEFKPENKDNEAPIIEIAEAITVNDSTYEIEGKVIDKSKKLFVQIDGETIPVKKGKFKIKRFSPVDEQLKIVALDQWGNKSKPKLVNITIDLKETELAEKLEQLNPSLIKSKSNKNRVALIIGIEKYEQTPAANFANLDAQYFYEYARKGFGIPKSNIKLLVDEDADLVKSISSINKWLPSKIKKNKTELIIFFAGHGLASNNGQELYILPQDSDPDLLSRTALSRTELFEQIISLNPKSVTMFMDTCYSGISRDEKMLLASARPIRIVADDQEGIPDNFTIFTASKLDQISSGLEEAKHGIFSYYLMKGLEGKADSNQDKKITNGELLAYMDENVSQKAAELGREQNPSLAGDPDKVLMSYR